MEMSSLPPTFPRVIRRAGTAVAVGAMTATALVAPAYAAPPRHREPIVQDLVSKQLRTQKITWHPCKFPELSPETTNRLLAVPGLQCATITVPRDWYRARDGVTISVEISRTPATNPAKRRGIMMINPGGPGTSGLAYGPWMQLRSPDVAEAYDTIGFDPRGVGQSAALECTFDENATTQAEWAKRYAEGCLKNPLTPFITTRQTTLDMDFVRYLLGERKLNYIGYSYGTWLGGSYAATFPSKTDRFLLDSLADMSQPSPEATFDLQAGARERQFQDMLLPYVARHDDVYDMGTDPIAVRSKFEAAGGFDNYVNVMAGADAIVGGMLVTSRYEIAATMVAVIGHRTEGIEREDPRLPYGNAEQEKMRRAIEQMKASVNTMKVSAQTKSELSSSLSRSLSGYQRRAGAAVVAVPQPTTVRGAFYATICQDGQWTSDLDAWADKLTYRFRHAPLTGMMDSIPPCAFWPAKERGFTDLTKDQIPPMFFLQSEFDPATAYEGANRSMRKFRAAKSVLIDDEGSHGLFPYGTECVDAKAYAWLLDGRLPRQQRTPCVGVPLPNEIYTYNVGGTINRNGHLRGFKMESESVRRASEIVAELREAAGIPDVPGDAGPGIAPEAAVLPMR